MRMSSNPTQRLAIVFCACVVIQACQTTNDLPESQGMEELSPAASQAIADDMTARLTEHMSPAGGTVQVERDGSHFMTDLETSLAGAGYAIASADDPGKADGYRLISYFIQPFDGQVLARIATKDVDLMRTYAVTESGAAASGPLTVKQRG